jgi:hypothetical protein
MPITSGSGLAFFYIPLSAWYIKGNVHENMEDKQINEIKYIYIHYQ